ncbi:MAG TPA: hypothetical protein VM578_00395 [Candidatus Saccharimonadales bacterium]|nr:hypothetical protein [Candidatus Saccharimonadales bacterium]
MHLAARANVESGVVPLHSAVLCVDCESITMGLSDECLVCGSHSLFNLERLLGGTQPSRTNARSSGSAVLFDTDIAIRLTQTGPRELSAIVEAIGNLLRSRQIAGEAEIHLNVEPVIAPKAAASDSESRKAA